MKNKSNFKFQLKFLVLPLITYFCAQQFAFSYGLGIAPYPIPEKVSVLTTEITGLVSDGRGMGIQARYARKVNPYVQIEGGFGFSDGERPNRFFCCWGHGNFSRLWQAASSGHERFC